MYLITGASGFIGSRLVNALKSMSLPIILLGREKIPGFKTILLNLEDELITDGLFDDVETIIHLAGYAHSAKKSPSKKYSEQRFYVVDVNIDGVVKSPIYCVVVFFQTLGILHVWPRS